VSPERTTAALLLDIDPISLVRGKRGLGLFDYVNDRSYVSSSFMSTAISKVFGTAMSGRGDDHQELADSELDLSATITMLPCKEHDKLTAVFAPLGYQVSYYTFESDEQHPEWGDFGYVNLTIKGNVRLRDLLKHLYVLIPVFDKQKHYWVDTDEVEKLLRMGQDWLPDHPERQFITSRYLKRQRRLVDMVFERLAAGSATEADVLTEPVEQGVRPLFQRRLEDVFDTVKATGATSVIDLGCGEGNLLKLFIADSQFRSITGVDVSTLALKRCSNRLNMDEAGESMLQRIRLFQGSLTYKDERLRGYQVACVVEVIEHIDPPRLQAFEEVLFGYARPRTIVLTTPNSEYNAVYQIDTHRHEDHRFEWTRAQFHQWAVTTAEKYGYTVRFSGIGDDDEVHGPPTQMGVFTCE